MIWNTEIHRSLPFAELERRQLELFEIVRRDPTQAFLLASEPLPTYTAGRQASPEELVWNQAFCQAKGIDLVPVSRGGKWTYHGPGQIVIYPICHLPTLGYGSRGVRPFLKDLRRSLGDFLTHHNIASEERDEPYGLYVGGKKIASFGIQVRHGVVLHGVALYYGDQNAMLGGDSIRAECRHRSIHL